MATFLPAPTATLSSHPSIFLPNLANRTFFFPLKSTPKIPILKRRMPSQIQSSTTDLVPGLVQQAIQLAKSTPPTWQSALLSNACIFLLGSPLLASGLSLSGFATAFLLGTLTWRAFGSSGFLIVAAYFLIGTAATKVKMDQKEAQGIAEKMKGKRGPGSVIGSSAAGCVCALLSIYGVGGGVFARLWGLGFVSSFCTKLSDTVSSEIGKAYGRTTYLVTTFKIVPRGTEGAVSVEGTLAGILASILLASAGCLLGLIDVPQVVICVVASQIANVGESIIGAVFQEKEGFGWHLGSPFTAVITPKLPKIGIRTQWLAIINNRQICQQPPLEFGRWIALHNKKKGKCSNYDG